MLIENPIGYIVSKFTCRVILAGIVLPELKILRQCAWSFSKLTGQGVTQLWNLEAILVDTRQLFIEISFCALFLMFPIFKEVALLPLDRG